MNAVVHRSGVRSATLALVVCAAVVATPQPVRAADYFWTGSGATGGNGTWSNVNSWSTIVSGTNRPATGPGALDNVYFGITNATSAATVTLSTDAAARSITQSTQTGNMTIASTSGATDRTLTIGAGGLTVASNLSPAWTIGGTGATNRVNVAVDGSQIWSVTGLGNTTFTVRNVVSRTAGDTTSRTLALDMGSGVQGTLTLGDVRDGGSSGSLSLWQAGMTPLAYGTSASYTGRTTISSGRISLAANSLSTSGTLALRTTTNTSGVSLGTGSVTTPQIVVETGMNSFGFASSGTATLGTITRTGGAVVFSGIGTGSTAYLVSNGNNAAGILGAWAIAGNNQYVTVASGSLAVATPTFVGETGLTSTNGVYAVPGNATITLTGPRFAYVVSSSNNFGSTFQIGNNNLTLSGLNAINGGWSVSRGAGNTGQLIIGSDNELNLTGATTFTISVPIVDGAGGAGKLTYAANGSNSSLTLSGSNSYSGGTEVGYSTVNNSNGLALNNAYALGTGTLTINPAGDARSGLILQNTSGAAITLATNNAQVWNGNFRFGGPSDLNMGTGTVSLGATPNAARTVTVNAATLTIGGRIVNGSHADLPTTGLTVSGSALGRLLLSGSNGYTGPTTVSGGILEFATRRAIYGGDTSKWTAANLTTGSGGVMALDVGAAGEFTSTDLDTFKSLGTGTSGFLPGSFLGIDTTTVAGGTFTYSSNIANTNGGANAFGIAKIGPGTLVLSGNNTMTGGVSVRGGSLLLTAANQIGTGPMTLVSGTLSTSSDAFMTSSPLTFSGGVLQVTGTSLTSLSTGRTTNFTAGAATGFDIADVANTFTVSQAISSGSAGSLTKLGPGALVLTASNNYTGSTVLGSAGGPTGGTLRLSGAAWISGTSGTAAPLIYSGTLDTNGINVTTAAFSLGGGAAATTAGVMTGSGTLMLGGNVTFDATNNPGGSTIAGNVSLGNATRTFTVGDSTSASSDLTISAAITSGTLTKAGAGVLLLSGTNTYAGVTTVSAGALVASSTAALPGWNTNGYTVSAGGALAMGSGFSNVESGTVIAGGTFAANSSVGFDTSGGNRDYDAVIGNRTGARGLVKLGSGTLTLSAVNTYTGTTAVNEGTLRIGTANAISGSSALALAGNGSLDLANAISAAAVTLSGSGSIFGSATLTGSSYTINNTAGTTTVSAILGGTATTVTLTKSNAGTAVLSGLNTYRGATTVSGGVLEFNSIADSGTANASALGAPAAADASITLGSSTASATLLYTGTGHSSNRTISTGSAGGIVDASGSGALNMSSGTISATAGTTVWLTGTSTAANSIGVISGSNVTKTGPGLWQLTGNSSYNGRLTVLDGTVVVASVGSGNSPFGSNTGTASLPRIGDSAVGASGTAALLAQSGSVSRGLYVNQSNGSQVVVLGGTGAGTTFFDSAIRLGRSVTLQASTGGTVEFGGEWRDLNEGSSPQVAFTVGSAGNAGTVVFGSKAPDSITAVNVRRGTLQLNYGVNGTSAIWYATPVTLGETGFGATLDLNQQRVETEAGPIYPSVTQSLGDLTFAGVGSTVTGTGTLRLFKSGSGAIVNVTGTGHQISAAVALADNSTFTLDSGARLVVSSTISGSSDASLTKTGLGTLTLSAANTYSGATQVNAGTLALGISNALSNSTPVSVAGGILDLGSSSDTVASLTLTSGSVTGSGGTLTAATYSLGGGAVSANLGGGTLNVTGNTSLTGNSAASAVNLNAGGLTLGGGSRLTGAPVVTGSSGASLTLGGNESLGSLAGFANIGLGGSGNRLTVGSSNSSTTYSGVLSGAGGLTKTGTGVFTLAGNNTYSGSTSISDGTFVVNGSLGSGALSVAAAAKLMGSGTIGGAATIAGIHSPGNSPGIETFSSDLTYSGGSSQVIWELWGNTDINSPLAYDQIVVGGNLNFAGLTSLVLDFGGSGFGAVNWNNSFWGTDQTWTLFDLSESGTTSNFSNFGLVNTPASWLDANGLAFSSSSRKDNTFTVSQQGSDVLLRYTVVVPEPASLALATIGIAAAAWAARRRK